jgi:hypothetical protein
MRSEAGQRGIVEPIFNANELVPLLTQMTAERADRQMLKHGIDFWHLWGEVGPSTIGPPTWHLVLAIRPGTPMVILTPIPGVEQLSRSECIFRVEKLFADAQAWPETLAYQTRNQDSGYQLLQMPLVDKLDDLRKRHSYKRDSGCPRCV